MRETRSQIVEILNNSRLPLEVMQYIVKEIFDATKEQADFQYKEELKKYTESERENGDTD